MFIVVAFDNEGSLDESGWGGRSSFAASGYCERNGEHVERAEIQSKNISLCNLVRGVVEEDVRGGPPEEGERAGQRRQGGSQFLQIRERERGVEATKKWYMISTIPRGAVTMKKSPMVLVSKDRDWTLTKKMKGGVMRTLL